jgi:hypothetical protein
VSPLAESTLGSGDRIGKSDRQIGWMKAVELGSEASEREVG